MHTQKIKPFFRVCAIIWLTCIEIRYKNANDHTYENTSYLNTIIHGTSNHYFGFVLVALYQPFCPVNCRCLLIISESIDFIK